MKMTFIVICATATLLTGLLYLARQNGTWPFASVSVAGAHTAVREPIFEHYVLLEKLVVMTRSEADEDRPRYLAMDLAFGTASEADAVRVKAQLPLLRSVAVRTLTRYQADQLRAMKVDAIAALLEQEYLRTYGSKSLMPFSQVLVVRMLLE
jgi:flagellar protein FliL